MSKYRASPPTYAHILLTTPQKHPWLASYQLWSRSGQAQAQKSRKTAQNCQTHHFAVLPGPQSTSYARNTFLRKNDVKPFTHCNLLKILIIRSGNEKTRFRELRKLIFRFFFEHKVEWGVHLHKPVFEDQMSKYRASPPTCAHILLTTPQKHPWLTSYQLWSHSEQAQAQTSRKTAKITFFTCFSRFAAITIENPALLKPFGNFSKKWKKNLAYPILLCMKTIQKIFWVVLSSIRPIFKLLKNVHVELASVSKKVQCGAKDPDLKTPGQFTLRKTS